MISIGFSGERFGLWASCLYIESLQNPSDERQNYQLKTSISSQSELFLSIFFCLASASTASLALQPPIFHKYNIIWFVLETKCRQHKDVMV